MGGLFGVMDEQAKDEVWTYEAASAEHAAQLYLDDPEAVGTVVRVWTLGRYPAAFVKTKGGAVQKIASPESVKK